MVGLEVDGPLGVVLGSSKGLWIGPKVDGQHVLSMYFFFYVFDGWSIVKLTGSMFFLDLFLRHLRWMVDREVDGPVWVVVGHSWGLSVRSWAALGAYVGGVGAVLGRS